MEKRKTFKRERVKNMVNRKIENKVNSNTE